MAEQINERFLKNLPIPSDKKDKLYTDSQLKGFCVRITNKGSISFHLAYVFSDKQTKYKIGDYPSINCATARSMAIALKGDIIRGVDPQEKNRSKSEIPTFAEFVEDFLKLKVKTLRASTFRDYKKYHFESELLPKFGRLRLDAIGKRDIEIFHASLSKSPYYANKLLAVLNAVFNQAIEWEILTKNPIKGIKKFTEHKRERYLSDLEIQNLFETLENEPSKINVAAVKLILLTGSRKGEVLSARWQDFDLEKGIWSKPAFLTKQNKSSVIPLNQEALEVIKGIERKADYLFFNEDTKTHIKDLKSFWAGVCKKAGIEKVRIHDLRHTFASVLVSKGVGLEVIGKLIGHSNIKTTQRYAHLANSALKEATELFKTKN